MGVDATVAFGWLGRELLEQPVVVDLASLSDLVYDLLWLPKYLDLGVVEPL